MVYEKICARHSAEECIQTRAGKTRLCGPLNKGSDRIGGTVK